MMYIKEAGRPFFLFLIGLLLSVPFYTDEVFATERTVSADGFYHEIIDFTEYGGESFIVHVTGGDLVSVTNRYGNNGGFIWSSGDYLTKNRYFMASDNVHSSNVFKFVIDSVDGNYNIDVQTSYSFEKAFDFTDMRIRDGNAISIQDRSVSGQANYYKVFMEKGSEYLFTVKNKNAFALLDPDGNTVKSYTSSRSNEDVAFTYKASSTGVYTYRSDTATDNRSISFSLYELIGPVDLMAMPTMTVNQDDGTQFLGTRAYAVKADPETPYVIAPSIMKNTTYSVESEISYLTRTRVGDDRYDDSYNLSRETRNLYYEDTDAKPRAHYAPNEHMMAHIHEWDVYEGKATIDLNSYTFTAKTGDVAKKYVEVLNAEDREASLVADPVDAFAGNFVDNRELLSYSGNNPLSFTMSYDSIANNSVVLRGGFVHNFETFIKETENGLSVYWTPNSVVHFDLVNEQYKPVHAKQSEIFVNKTDAGFTVVDASKQQYEFDLEGKLVTFTDKLGHQTFYSYTNQRLMKVENSKGQSFAFTYTSDGKLSTVTDTMKRKLQFSYDYSTGLLGSVRYPNGKTLQIRYVAAPSSDLPYKVKGLEYDSVSLVENRYDAQGRVVKQWDGNKNLTEFTYDEFSNDDQIVTTITTGSRKEVLTHDYLGNLLKKTDGEGFSETHTYDKNRNVTSTVDENGHKYLYEYDAKNRLVLTKNPDKTMVAYDYDEDNHITKITMPDGKIIHHTYQNGRLDTSTDRAGNQTVYTYDKYGNATSINREGHDVKYGYDAKTGYLTSVSTNDGPVTQFVNDALGRVIKTILPDETFTESVYDVDNNIVKSTDQKGQSSEFTYNAFGNVLTEKNPNGVVTTHKYDANGNRINTKIGDREVAYKYNAFNQVIETAQVVNGESKNKQTFMYNNRGELTDMKDADNIGSMMSYDGNGNVLTTKNGDSALSYMYDVMGNTTAVTDSYGNETTFTHDAVGNILSETTPSGSVIQHNYDDMNRLSSTTDSLGHKTKYEYDLRGNLIRVTDANGAETTYEYNDNNQETAEINAVGERQEMTYNALGQLVSVKNNRDEVVLSYEYDALGLVSKITDGNGHTNTFTYDTNGNRLTFTDGEGHVSEVLTYNTYDDMSKSTDALGYETVFEYDALGNLSKRTDPKGNTSTDHYTSANRLAGVTDPLNTRIDYTYDIYGQIAAIGQGDDPNQKFTRDLNQNLIEEQFDKNSIKYEYNAENELVKKTNGRSQDLSYEYDANGRLTKETTPEGVTSYEYDAVGNVLIVESPDSHIERTYDLLGRVVSKTQDGQTIKYQYDDRGHLVRIEYPTGKAVDYTYDVMGNLLTVTDWNGRKTQYEYNANNQLIKTTHANGTEEVRTYDAKGQVLTLINKKGSTMLSSYAYEYDANGNIVKENDAVLKYDALNRLTQAGSNTYAYNLLANITEFTTTLADGSPYKQTMSYDITSELTWLNDVRTSADGDGNLTQYALDGKTHKAAYDSQNQLISFDGVTYKYDEESNRIGLVEDAVDTSFVVDNDSHAHSRVLVEETNGESIYHVYGHGLIGSYTADGAFETHHYDYRGSTTGVSDESGSLIGSVSYDEYGVITHQDESVNTRFLYNGKYGVQTDANGLYHMRARYYNPELKRFMNRDVVLGSITEPQTLNRYAFVNGNPISYHDPFGLARETLSNTVSTITSMLHTGLDLAGMVPGFGMVPDAINAALYLAKGDYTNMALSSMAIIPFVGDAATGAKYIGKYADDVAELGIKGYNKVKHTGGLLKMDLQTFAKTDTSNGIGKYTVGLYNEIKGVPNLDAHHVGQKAIMKKFVKNYDDMLAPAINVPKVGHTKRMPGKGIVSRSSKGIDSARDLLARDIHELRRVYEDIPNDTLRELIDLNKKMYPEMRK